MMTNINFEQERKDFEAHAIKFFKSNEVFEVKNDSYIYDEIIFMWDCWINRAKKQHESQLLENDCMIDQTWFMKGTSIANLIKHAENVYKAEVAAQNSKIEFGTDDNEHWFAHEVPFFGKVQISKFNENGLIEWDIHFSECWQGPFESKSRCIQHLEECIAEKREEAKEG